MLIGVRYDNGYSNVLKVNADDLLWHQMAKIAKADFPHVKTVLVSVPLKPAAPVKTELEAA